MIPEFIRQSLLEHRDALTSLRRRINPNARIDSVEINLLSDRITSAAHRLDEAIDQLDDLIAEKPPTPAGDTPA